MRAFWNITGSILFATTIGWGTYNIATLLGHSERDEVREYAAADVHVVDVHNSAGGVTVIGTDAATSSGTIEVTAHISEGIRGTENKQSVVDGVLRVRASCPNFGSMWCEATYTIEVPHDMAVKLRADNDGIHVSDITGAVDVGSDNGSVTLTGLSGDIVGESDNGDVRATKLTSATVMFSTDNGDVRAQFDAAPNWVIGRTDNGSVTVAVPAGDSYNVKTSTDNGSTHVDVTNDPNSSRTIDIATDNGSVTVRYND
jgi:hypothetical protein